MDEKTKNLLDESAHLDLLIDNALGTYTTGEPRCDLSARILSAAHALQPCQRSAFQFRPTGPWVFATAGGLAVTAMLFVWMSVRNLQIVIQPRPAAAQLALSAPPTLSDFPATASASIKTAPDQPMPRVTHFQHAIRTVSSSRGRLSDRANIFQPITFEPIVIDPIRSEEN